MFSGAVDYHPYFESSALEELSVTVSCLPSAYGGSTPQCNAYASGGGGDYSYDWNVYGCDGSSSCTTSCGGSYVSVTVTSATRETEAASTTSGACRDYGGGDGTCDPGELCIAGATSTGQKPYATLDRAALRKEIQKLERKLQKGPGVRGSAELLQQLYSLLLLDAKVGHARQGSAEVVFAGVRANAKSIFAGYVNALRMASAGGLGVAERRAGEAAMLITVENLIRAERYGEALARAKTYMPHLKGTSARKSLMLLKAVGYEQSRQYAQALKAVRAAAALAPAGAASHYEPIERRLRRRLGRSAADAAADPSAARENSTLRQSEAKELLPESFGVGVPYPNPTNGKITLPLSLPESANVRIGIYDVLGRRVRIIADQYFTAGRPELTVEAGGLSSGMYLVRVHITSGAGASHVFTKEIVVVQ